MVTLDAILAVRKPASEKYAPASRAEPASLARWGWLPLLGASTIFAALAPIGWAIGLDWAGHDLREADNVLTLVIAATAAALVAGVLSSALGWFVLRARRRIERAREELHRANALLTEQAIRAHHEAGLGALARILAHEMRTPVHDLTLGCALLLRTVDGSASDSRERAREIALNLGQKTGQLTQLLTGYFARAEPTEIAMETLSLDSLVRDVVERFASSLEARRIAVEVEGSTTAPISVDREKIQRLVAQLLQNATEALEGGGRIQVRLGTDGSRATLAVADDGPGFRDPQAAFRPFYTTKPRRIGVGLAIVRDIVRAHRGEVRAENLSPKGARVEVCLPLGTP